MGQALTAYEKEQKAQKRARTCMCGCGKGEPPTFDESRDPTEQLDSLTAVEIFQQQQGMFTCADPFETLARKEEIQAIVAAGDDPEEAGFSKAEIEDVLSEGSTVQAE